MEWAGDIYIVKRSQNDGTSFIGRPVYVFLIASWNTYVLIDSVEQGRIYNVIYAFMWCREPNKFYSNPDYVLRNPLNTFIYVTVNPIIIVY